MSKPTETTNERVPRDIVCLGTNVLKRGEASGWWSRKRREASGGGVRC